MMSTFQKKLSVSQTIKHIHASTGIKIVNSTVVRWCATGMVPAVKIGARWFIAESSINDYMANIGMLINSEKQGDTETRGKEGKRYNKKVRKKDFFSSISKSSKQSVHGKKNTFVYLMQHTNGLTKIGQSKNPKARERTLQAEDPRLRLVFYVESAAGLESRLHKIFDSVRVRGEWFDLMPHHVDWIVFLLSGRSFF